MVMMVVAAVLAFRLFPCKCATNTLPDTLDARKKSMSGRIDTMGSSSNSRFGTCGKAAADRSDTLRKAV